MTTPSPQPQSSRRDLWRALLTDPAGRTAFLLPAVAVLVLAALATGAIALPNLTTSAAAGSRCTVISAGYADNRHQGTPIGDYTPLAAYPTGTLDKVHAELEAYLDDAFTGTTYTLTGADAQSIVDRQRFGGPAVKASHGLTAGPWVLDDLQIDATQVTGYQHGWCGPIQLSTLAPNRAEYTATTRKTEIIITLTPVTVITTTQADVTVEHLVQLRMTPDTGQPDGYRLTVIAAGYRP